MEFSVSSMVKLPSNPLHGFKNVIDDDDDDEQSSWTFYIDEDFMKKDHGNINTSCVSSDDFLVSGSVSLDEKKSFRKIKCRSLSFKRQRNKKVWDLRIENDEDDLEDTASSPLNSPKEKGTVWEKLDKRNDELHVDGAGDKSYSTELKKRGLCVVPLSMLANFVSN